MHNTIMITAYLARSSPETLDIIIRYAQLKTENV